MFQIFKQWWMPLAFVIATQISVVRADTIRVVGPDGQIKSSPTFSEPVRAQSLNQADEPSRFYGPTNGNETLWSIASRLRPDNSVSVQQTLLAIYRLNPQAFENQNIHSLVPSSYLRVPSLEQARASSTQQAIRIMDSHQAKLNAASSQPVAPAKPEVAKTPKPAPVVKPEKVEPKVTTETKPTASSKPMVSPQENEVNLLEKQLEMSESELLSLEEKNHQLRLMLSNVQSEVEVLKTELSDEDRIRNEVEKLLEEERQKNAEIEKMAPSTMDQLLSNGWLVAAMAIIPGLLIGLIIVLLMGRKSKKEEPEQAAQESNNLPEQSNVVPMPLDQEMAELDNELSLEDELFGADDDTEKLFDDENTNEQDDVFAGLDDADLDFNLDGEDDDPFAGIGDDGDLDGNFDDIDLDSNNGISVNGEEKALGLEEMERALDETVESALDSDEGDFDLSDDNPMSADDIEALLSQDAQTEDLGSSELDQSMLDDLFASTDDDDDSFDLDTLMSEDDKPATPGVSDDFDIDALISEQQSDTTTEPTDLSDDFDIDALISEQQDSTAPSSDASDDFDIDTLISEQQTSESEAPTSNDDIDDIFAQATQQLETPAEEEPSFNLDDDDLTSQFTNELASDDDIESILSKFDQPVPEGEELIGDDLLDSAVETPSEESTDLLDELLDGDDVDLSNSTDLLDEMLGDDDANAESEQEHLDLDPLNELEELSGLSEENEDDFTLDESSTDLLDDFLDDDDSSLSLEDDETLDELLSNDFSESALSDDQSDEESASLDPFDDLLTSGIDDLDSAQESELAKEAEPAQMPEPEAVTTEEVSFEQSLSSALEETSETTDKVEPASQDVDSFEEQQEPELSQEPQVEAEPIAPEALQTDNDVDVQDEVVPPSEPANKDFNRNDFMDDMFDIAPQADALFDEHNTQEPMVESDDTSSDSPQASTSEQTEPLEELQGELEQQSESAEEVSPELNKQSGDLEEVESLLSQQEPDLVPTQNDLERALAPEQDTLTSMLEDDIDPFEQVEASPQQATEEQVELEDDWLSCAIDDVESPQEMDSDFDFLPQIEASEPQLDVDESLPEPEP
ncbi:FimV/HubP family polar landmark protein, partial [Vibrio sp. D449a]